MKYAKDLCALSLGVLAGCSFHARGPDDYRKATRELLDTKSNGLEACYERELKASDRAKGVVVVRFEVEAKTGSILKPEVVGAKTTAPQGLQSCVLDALGGLALDPPDQRTGAATFAWQFGSERS